ncbi:MAG TPA: trypsin-like peptidase domain-containing protein [Flavobacteriales bacterium]|nr:trypsin-like peptidase domain-containing protein [Flavobacteriales bacterium]
MLRKTLWAAAPALSLALLTGCASLLNKGNQTVQVNTEPAGAKVIVNGTQVGLTPYAWTFTGQAGDEVTMELAKDGHETATVVIKPHASKGVLLADALLLGIPYIVDAKSSALSVVAAKELNVRLYRSFPKDRKRIDVPVAALDNGLQPRADLGRVGNRKLLLSNREFNDLRYPQNGAAVLVNGFAGTGWDAFVARPGTEKGNQDIFRSKVLLKPLVKVARMDLKSRGKRVSGPVHLEMDWRFYSGINQDSLLFTVSTSTDKHVLNISPSSALSEALRDAARQLAEDDDLHGRLAEVRSAGWAQSKGGKLELSRPRPIEFADRKGMFPALIKAVVTLETKNGHGSGFLITNDGYLLSNAHVVGNNSTVKVRFEQGFSLEGEVVKLNTDFDLALVKVPGSDLPALSLGDDAGLAIGEELFAIGTPLDERLGQSVSRGIMSGMRVIDGRKYLQTDVSINPGNSGGPLVDDSGQVMGIATMKVSATGVEGIGFGVPLSTALEMLNIVIQP